MIQRSLSGIFCDDIREEIRGKRSLIGCYAGIMEVSSFPITLPKLCIHGIIQTPAERPFKSVRMLVLRDEEVLTEGELPIIEESSNLEEVSNDPGNLIRLDVEFVLSPLTIDRPCVFRLRAHVDGEEIRGLALHVRPLTQELSAPVAS